MERGGVKVYEWPEARCRQETLSFDINSGLEEECGGFRIFRINLSEVLCTLAVLPPVCLSENQEKHTHKWRIPDGQFSNWKNTLFEAIRSINKK